MRILLTNDDGIFSPGITELRKALERVGECIVVAPDSEKSAVGHAITLHKPLFVKEVKDAGKLWGYSVSGTPADCVKLGLCELIDGQVDIVISGINRGANVGVNLLYSGTVSAASESVILGVRAIAVSLDSREHDADYSYAAKIATQIAVSFASLPFATCSLNVNVPALPEEEIEGVFLAPQGNEKFFERFERRTTPRGDLYFWLDSSARGGDTTGYSDAQMLAKKMVVVTPVGIDLTRYDLMEGIATQLGLEKSSSTSESDNSRYSLTKNMPSLSNNRKK
ncbi:MAG: 5'/3'-nucleotidase SurE [Deltaproteobacteria bacterium]|nr:5'/3'-nucleotidase SurE [Deltaproteobacteria bacterium]